MSPLSFLILIIRMLFLCPLVSLAKGLSILLIFSKNQLLDWLIPVSYTHLRAHETSLHLVCRLLLEKKKLENLDKMDKFLDR